MGGAFLEKLEEKFLLFREVPVECSYTNRIVVPYYHHIGRDSFFKYLDTMTITENLEKRVHCKYNIGLYNFYSCTSSIGSNLTAFALGYFLEHYDNGKYNVCYINYENNILKLNYKMFGNNGIMDKFVRDNIPRMHERKSFQGLPYLNNLFSHFIVGSDAVFLNTSTYDEWFLYLLQFVDDDKKILSCASSFTSDEIVTNTYNVLDYVYRDIPLGTPKKDKENSYIKKLYSYSLKRFDKISVREDSGVKICNELGVEATHVLDPVFYIDRAVYDKLADKSKIKQKYNAVCYPIGETFYDNIKNYIKNTNKKYFDEIQDIVCTDYHISINDTLHIIRNSNIVFTNSFHGSCIAILYRKEFVFIHRSPQLRVRIESLAKLLNIKNRVITCFDEINLEYIKNNPINYDEVYKILDKYKDKSIKYLIDSIEKTETNEETINTKRTYRKKLSSLYKRQLNNYKFKSFKYNFINKIFKKKIYNDEYYEYIKKMVKDYCVMIDYLNR